MSTPNRPYSLVYSVGYPGLIVSATYYFVNEEAGQRWKGEVQRVKDVSRANVETIRGMGGLDSVTMEEKNRLWLPWLASVDQIIETYGRENVPFDVAYAVNDAERGLGRPVSEFTISHLHFRVTGPV